MSERSFRVEFRPGGNVTVAVFVLPFITVAVFPSQFVIIEMIIRQMYFCFDVRSSIHLDE